MNLAKTFKINGKFYTPETILKQANLWCNSKKDYLKSLGLFVIHWFDEKPFLNVFTSGSTSAPKEIKIKKMYFINSAKMTIDFFNLKTNDTALLCLSTDYIAGKMMLIRTFVAGLDLKITKPSKTPLKNNNDNYDFCAMTMIQVKCSLNKLQQIKKIILGGSPVDSKLSKAIQSINTTIYETFGMTETVSHIALKNLTQNESYFTSLPRVKIAIKDNLLSITAPTLSDEIIYTKDRIQLINETQFIWLGREQNVINTGGVKFYAEQIEAKIRPYIPDVCFFVGKLFDKDLGEKIIIVFQGDEKMSLIISKQLKKVNFKKYEKPKSIFSLPELKRTKTGKIDRRNTLKLIERKK